MEEGPNQNPQFSSETDPSFEALRETVQIAGLHLLTAIAIENSLLDKSITLPEKVQNNWNSILADRFQFHLVAENYVIDRFSTLLVDSFRRTASTSILEALNKEKYLESTDLFLISKDILSHQSILNADYTTTESARDEAFEILRNTNINDKTVRRTVVSWSDYIENTLFATETPLYGILKAYQATWSNAAIDAAKIINRKTFQDPSVTTQEQVIIVNALTEVVRDQRNLIETTLNTSSTTVLERLATVYTTPYKQEGAAFIEPGSEQIIIHGHYIAGDATYISGGSHMSNNITEGDLDVSDTKDNDEYRIDELVQELEDLPNISSFEERVPKDYREFIGRTEQITTILDNFRSPTLDPIINIVGLGGMGKTALAIRVAELAFEQGLFEHIVWSSNQKQTLIPSSQINTDVFTFESVLDDIIRQTDSLEVTQIADIEEKRMGVAAVLEYNPTLIIMDSMETVPNREEIIEQLYNLLSNSTGISKILLTSRLSFKSNIVNNLNLQGFPKSEGFNFIDVCANEQQLNSIIHADKSQKERIYNLTGGSPLALRFIIGRSELSNIDSVLHNLESLEAIKYDDKSYDFYRSIHLETWKELGYESQAGLVYLATSEPAIGASIDEIKFSLTGLGMSESQIDEGLKNLTKVSLINKIEKNNKTRYTMHLLTYNFVLSEVTQLKKWEDNLVYDA